MDCFANEKDYMLLNNDKYTFFVLKRLLDGENKLLLTDHERLIICFSGEPYPVWIWNADEPAKWVQCDQITDVKNTRYDNVKDIIFSRFAW